MNLLRAFSPEVFDLCESYRVTDEALMPEEYRAPNGRWKHPTMSWNKEPRYAR